MLETSLDLLYIVIAFCILWLTIFTCWWLFYIVMIIRRVYQIIKTIKEKLKLIDQLTQNAKNKLEHASMYIDLAAQGIGKIVGYIKNKKTEQEEPVPPKTRKKKVI
jgi:ascorbate-specific PTS system EIIC-type component UlaA